MCHLPNCHNTSCGSCPPVLEWIYLSRHTPSAQSIPSVSVISSRTYVNLDVYVHMIARSRLDVNCVCIWWRISSRCMWAISTRFIHTYDTMIYEWWWESRLDLVEESRWDNLVVSYYEMCESRLENYSESRLGFYVWIPRNFRPVGWQLALLMLRSLSTQDPQGFRLDSIRIVYRFQTDYQTI